MTTPALSERSILEVLTRERLVGLGRELGVSVSQRARKDEQIEELYRVVLMRLEPIGLVYLWPETRG
ncbi:MAG: hypothetical protein ACRD3V_22750 [Vicinamibacteria bacterium]